jgi:hypothetical protein
MDHTMAELDRDTMADAGWIRSGLAIWAALSVHYR